MRTFDQDIIVNVAFTGAVSDPKVNPNVPVRVDQIVADAAQCARMGASIGHFHVRDENARPTNDPNRYHELFCQLRADGDVGDFIVCASTSGRHGQTFEERAAVLDLPAESRPDMASLTLASLNFRDGASINQPDIIRRLAERMAKCGVKPELEVFDLGMMEFAHELIREGLITPPYYFNVILGNVASAKTTFSHIAALTSHVPENSLISFGGIGPSQMPAHLAALAGAHGIRVGLEDNLWFDARRTPATNPALVERFVSLARLSGRRIATAGEVRAKLGLSPRCPEERTARLGERAPSHAV